MLNLNKYSSEFKSKLAEQLNVYVTLGGKNESPMWFQFVEQKEKQLFFRSSQVDYMFFHIDILPEDKSQYFEYKQTYGFFRDLKYSFIKENYPTVYYEIRPNEKQVVNPVLMAAIPNVEDNSTTDYQQQAIDFLNATGTTFSSEFLRFDFHFDGDKQKRNIFKITLKNDRHKYSFEFGSSLQDSLMNCKDILHEDNIDFFFGLKYQGLKREYLTYTDKLTIEQIKNSLNSGNNTSKLIDKAKATNIYTEFVEANTNKYTQIRNIISLKDWLDKLYGAIIKKASELSDKNFGEGIQSESIIHPAAYDVLSGITKNEIGTFDDFCSDFGYDVDSRKAYKTYKAVLKEWKNVERLFNDEQLDALREIS